MNKESLKQELNIEIQRELKYMKFNGSDIEFEQRKFEYRNRIEFDIREIEQNLNKRSGIEIE